MKWSPPKAIQNKVGGTIQFQGCVKQLNATAPKLEPIPSTFRDVRDLTKPMTSHILEEGINSHFILSTVKRKQKKA